MRIASAGIAAAIVLSCSTSVHDCHAEDAPSHKEFEVYVENDMWAGTDRNYTNGMKFGFGAQPAFFKVPAESVLRYFSGSGAKIEFGMFLGQNMYTPRRITVATPQPFDRPWAAWLYLGGVAQRIEANRLQTVELDLGMVGPAALGEPVQRKWHRLIGSPEPEGWSNQIPNEPGVLLAYFEKRLIPVTARLEFIPHFGATIGNVMTLARAGGMVRAGYNMSGFGPDTIEPGGAMLQAIRGSTTGKPAFEWYGFVGADARAVARNVFLDGPLFSNSPSVERRPFVYDLTTGISMRYSRVRFSLTRINRSEEFTTPAGGGGRQIFHSLSLNVEF